MRLSTRSGVSPIIATLLLIAIAVAAGIIVYVFTNTLAGNLTQSGGQQVSEQLSMDAYSFPSAGTTPVIVLRDIGGSSLTINQVFFDGVYCQTVTGSSCSAPAFVTGGAGQCASGPVCATGQYTQMTLTITAVSVGTSHTVRVVTSDGGTFSFSVVAGRSG